MSGIQSFERAIYILEVIKKSEKPVTLTEISLKTSMVKSSLQRYLISFIKTNILSYDLETKTYTLGYKLMDFGLSALNRIDIISIIEPFLLNIKMELDQSSVLSLWTDQGPIVVKYQSSGRSINVEVKIGYSPPLLISSVGKCFAAFLPPEITKDIFSKEISAYKLNESAIKYELKQIKEKGFAFRESQFKELPGSQTIASPIFDHTGKITAVLGLVGFTSHLEINDNSNEVIKLKEITKQISKELGNQI